MQKFYRFIAALATILRRRSKFKVPGSRLKAEQEKSSSGNFEP
jgi:hypothetical protein